MFAGGGTGGHLFPAIAIADEIRKLQPDAAIVFIGTKEKLESTVVPRHGYKFESIWVSGLSRRKLLVNLLFPLKLAVSVLQSLALVRKYRPSAMVGTGGYVSGPAVFAAILSGVPTLIHEQNSRPGATTKLLGSRVSEVHVTYENSIRYFPRNERVRVSGNPTRASLSSPSQAEAYAYFGWVPDSLKKTVLVFGGSLGASSLNQAMLQIVDHLVNHGVRVIWQTGPHDLAKVKDAGKSYPTEAIWISAFIDRMDFAYTASDIVICRAGATTLAELTLLGKPAILVPYPHAAADHQTENALVMEKAGAAAVVRDNELDRLLQETLLGLLADEVGLRMMKEQSRKLGRPEAARSIAGRVLSLAGGIPR